MILVSAPAPLPFCVLPLLSQPTVVLVDASSSSAHPVSASRSASRYSVACAAVNALLADAVGGGGAVAVGVFSDSVFASLPMAPLSASLASEAARLLEAAASQGGGPCELAAPLQHAFLNEKSAAALLLVLCGPPSPGWRGVVEALPQLGARHAVAVHGVCFAPGVGGDGAAVRALEDAAAMTGGSVRAVLA